MKTGRDVRMYNAYLRIGINDSYVDNIASGTLW